MKNSNKVCQKAPSGKFPMSLSQFLMMGTTDYEDEIGSPCYFVDGLEWDKETETTHLVTINKIKKEFFFFTEEDDDSQLSAMECCLKILRVLEKEPPKSQIKDLIKSKWLPRRKYNNYTYIPGVIVFKGSRPYKEFRDKSNIELQNFVKKMGIKVFYANWNKYCHGNSLMGSGNFSVNFRDVRRYAKKNSMCGSKAYTKEELLKQLTKNRIKNCLNEDIIDNWLRTADTDEYYSEVFIEHLYDKKYLPSENFIKNINENSFKIGDLKIEYPKMLDVISECYKRNSIEKELGVFVDFIDISDDKVQLTKGKGYFMTYKKETSELFLTEIKYRLYNESALRNCISFKKHIQNLNMENIIKEFVKMGKLPQKDYKINFAIIVKDNGHKINPAEELKDKSRLQIQKMIKDLNIKIYHCYCKRL